MTNPDRIYTRERKAQFRVGNAFYRPQSQTVRDLGVLAAAIEKADRGKLRVLDGMTGCGIRSLRYWLESGADSILANEGNPDIYPVVQENLQAAIDCGIAQITQKDAHRLFFECYQQRDYYDLVDVDCFGSAAPYLSTMLWATKLGGLMYLTSTDGHTGTGHLPENSLKVYGAYARCHPASQEQVLRLLIGTVQQQAASKGFGVKPIFSFFAGQTYRVMLRLVSSPMLNSENYGFLGYCHHCGEYQTVSWRKLGRVGCSGCDRSSENPVTLSGPLWLGHLHNRSFVQRMHRLAQQWGWSKRVKLLETLAAEADFPPYFYTLAEIGHRGKLDIPKRSHMIQALKIQGYQATPTHLNPQAIKTDADLKTCITVAQSL